MSPILQISLGVLLAEAMIFVLWFLWEVWQGYQWEKAKPYYDEIIREFAEEYARNLITEPGPLLELLMKDK